MGWGQYLSGTVDFVPTFSPDVVAAVLHHMNDDHVNDSLLIARAFGSLDAETASMTDLDGDGGTFTYTVGPEQHHGIIPCPLLLQYAESDQWEYGGDPQAFYDRLDQHGTPTSHFSYIGTRHHFANRAITEAFDPQASALALARTSAFLVAQLVD